MAATPRRRHLLATASAFAIVSTVALAACGSAANSQSPGSSTGGVDNPTDSVGPNDSFSDDSFADDSFGPAPTPIATFTSGTATLKLNDGTTITLDQLGPMAQVVPDAGSQGVWYNDQGWYLTIQGPDLSVPQPSGASIDPADLMADVEIDRIVDAHHWHAEGSENCQSIVEHADTSGLDGSAACQGLVWIDELLSAGGLDPDVTPAPVAGQPPFDVQVTFDAH